MKESTKAHAGGFWHTVLLLSALGLLVPTSLGFVPAVNEGGGFLGKDLKVTEQIFETSGADVASASDFDVTYTYLATVAGEEKTVTLELNEVAAGILSAQTLEPWKSDLRVIGLDFAAMTGSNAIDAAKPPEYDEDKPNELLKIVFPETAAILFNKDVAGFCFGFVLERGDTATTETIVENYKIQVGSGSSVFYETNIDPKNDQEDDDDNGDGDATTDLKGDCSAIDDPDADRDDPANSRAEFGGSVYLSKKGEHGVPGIIPFLNDAYVQEDADDPTDLWVKVYGLRHKSPAAASTEDGDIADFAINFFTWEGSQTHYTALGAFLLYGGIFFGVVAAFMTVWLNVPWDKVSPNSHKLPRRAPRPGGVA